MRNMVSIFLLLFSFNFAKAKIHITFDRTLFLGNVKISTTDTLNDIRTGALANSLDRRAYTVGAYDKEGGPSSLYGVSVNGDFMVSTSNEFRILRLDNFKNPTFGFAADFFNCDQNDKIFPDNKIRVRIFDTSEKFEEKIFESQEVGVFFGVISDIPIMKVEVESISNFQSNGQVAYPMVNDVISATELRTQ